MDDTTTTSKRRGRPKAARPARSSAQKMREARERIQAALNAPGGEVGTLPDTLLLEALAVAYRTANTPAFIQGIRELTDRLNDRVSADWRIVLDVGMARYSDTVTEKNSDTVTDNPAPSEPRSARDAEILSRFAAGESKRGIARQLGISDSTVRNVLSRN